MAVSVFFLTPLFPGTECIALARTALSPPAASPRVQGTSLSAVKWLLNQLLLSSGSLFHHQEPAGRWWFCLRAGHGVEEGLQGPRGSSEMVTVPRTDIVLALSGSLWYWTAPWVMACGSEQAPLPLPPEGHPQDNTELQGFASLIWRGH